MKITPDMYKSAMELVNLGKYSSLEHFSELAFRNQLILENDTQQNSIHILDNTKLTTHNESFTGYQPRTIRPIPLSKERRGKPMWGLINRFAPGKLVLRMLASGLESSTTEWIDYKEFAADVVERAISMRNQIEKHYKNSQIVRGEGLQIGFPQKDENSRQRFADIYVGRLISDGRVDGFLGSLELGVIRKASDGSLQIGITEAGLKFANMKSPLLDEFFTVEHPIAFFKNEIHFLMNHVKKVRPGEYQFLDYLFTSVKNGMNTPQEIGNQVTDYVKKNKWANSHGGHISEAELNTMKVGGMARLVEMRLIRIEKDGIHTKYQASSELDSLEGLLNE